MNDDQEHLMTVFSAALARGSTAERQAYLDQACADDPHLRQRVEALLRAHDRAGAFLGRVPGAAETTAAAEIASGIAAGCLACSQTANKGDSSTG